MRNAFRNPSIRTLVWRLGRRLYCEARRDVPNNPQRNGEYWLLHKALSLVLSKPAVLLDVGANRGNWTAEALRIIGSNNEKLTIHALEPTPSTFEYFANRFASNVSVVTHNLALSDKTGEAQLYIHDDLAGSNSLHSCPSARTEKVRTLTMDSFVRKNALHEILMVKSDTEGHDLSVLLGAEQTLTAGRVLIWQFEYNHRWVSNHAFLRDVFDLMSDKPYFLGKLYPNGVELYDSWHPELERFFEGNYVLLHKTRLLGRFGDSVEFCSYNTLIPKVGSSNRGTIS